MTDTERLAALLHDLGIGCPTLPDGTNIDTIGIPAHLEDAARLVAAGVRVVDEPVVMDDFMAGSASRIERQAHLAYLYLNVVDCPKCHLPSEQGLVCPCGYDGATDD